MLLPLASILTLRYTLLLWAGFAAANDDRTIPGADGVYPELGKYVWLMGDARMATSPQYNADSTDEGNIDCASEQEPSFAAQLRKTLNTIPAYTWYAAPRGSGCSGLFCCFMDMVNYK